MARLVIYSKILILFLLFQNSVGNVSAQDIHSTSPIVLPQSPVTSYIIDAGKTVKITSVKSITLGPGVWIKSGADVTVRISNSPFIIPAPNNPAPNLDMNWVQTKSYDEDGKVIGEDKVFYDRVGKALQNQAKNISANHVLANQIIYDAQGRAAIETLIAPTNNSAFNFKADFVTNATGNNYTFQNFDLTKTNNPDALGNTTPGTLGWYYSNNNTFDPYVPATSYPYSRVDFFKDGSGAVKRSASTGEQLRMGSAHEEKSYVIPVVNELDHYLKVRNKFFSSTVVGQLPTSLGGQAIQSIMHDANGREAVMISDKDGNPLMGGRPGNDLSVVNTVKIGPSQKSVHYFKLLTASPINFSKGSQYTLYDMDGNEQPIFITQTLNPGYYKLIAKDSVVFTYNTGYTDLNYNFYNGSGQLLASIPPNGVKELITNGLDKYNALSDIPFVNINQYDLQGRLIANTEPDAGRTEFIYRKDGSIRFTQNAVQRIANPARFTYTNYDRWGRPFESGEYVSGTILFEAAKTNVVLQENTSADGGLVGGTKLSQVKTYYDLPDNSHGLVGYVQDEAFLKGAISLTESKDSKTWYNYDSEGRVSWLVKNIAGLGVKTIDYRYDAKGNKLSINFQKDNSTERFLHEYEYDDDNRLKVAYTTIGQSTKKELARYYYYLHGPLKRIELAGNLQGIDYTYTAQGWLKAINHPILATDPGKDNNLNGFGTDVFGMTMEYFNGDYLRSNTGISSLNTGGQIAYDGSVMAQSWRSQKPLIISSTYGAAVNDPSMVTYDYDDKYQFNSNKFGVPNFTVNSFVESVNKNREHNLTYDPNGNIKTLNRTNATGASVASFNYSYQNNTNKLTGINNYANYSYDNLGQMTLQTRANGQNYYVNYDVNGQVTAIYSDLARTQPRVSFAYDEGGMRISKTDHIQNVTTYYVYDGIGNMMAIYDNVNSALLQKEIPLYASEKIGLYSKVNNGYQFELKDHLGNVRAVINGTKLSNGQIDVLSYSDYYPFGSPLTLQSQNNYRYGYQGQFSEVDNETGWNNFNLRMYDPVIGRWMTTDPYGEFSSPYVGMGNNPISNVDPDGGLVNGGIDPEKPINQGTLKEVTIVGKRLNALERATSRNERGLPSGTYANGKIDYGVLYAKEAYGNYRRTMSEQPQFDAYIANTFTILSGGEIFEVPALVAGLGRVVVQKVTARGIITAVKSLTVRGSSIVAKEGGNTLRHYTTEAGYKAIMESGELLPSIGVKNARHGAGQYFTDLTSGYTSGQISKRLFGVPWNAKKLTHFIDINVSGLNVIKNAPHNFLVPGTNSLPLSGRIISHGASIFKAKL